MKALSVQAPPLEPADVQFIVHCQRDMKTPTWTSGDPGFLGLRHCGDHFVGELLDVGGFGYGRTVPTRDERGRHLQRS